MRILLALALVCAGTGASFAQKDIVPVGRWVTEAAQEYLIRQGLRQPRKYDDGFPKGLAEKIDGVALVIEFKADGDLGLGTVKQYEQRQVIVRETLPTPSSGFTPSSNITVTELGIETFKRDGSTFEFSASKARQIGGVAVPVRTLYRGRMIDDATMEISRLDPSGKPLDLKEDGTPDKLILHREVSPAPPEQAPTPNRKTL
jgi:hypothetical protein